jgi:hypothetical protein
MTLKVSGAANIMGAAWLLDDDDEAPNTGAFKWTGQSTGGTAGKTSQ